MPKKQHISRRGFITGASSLAATAAAANFLPLYTQAEKKIAAVPNEATEGTTAWEEEVISSRNALDLAPANWIWYPARRILPNSFFHFRKTFRAKQAIRSARGWIVGDSRYVLLCNGKRIQFGPAPSDPRFTEADPVDLAAVLQKGDNVIGATVLYFGFGDGTWPAGKAGFIFKLDVEYQDGSKEVLISDASWTVQLAKSWEPGMYKRWYLRALQESFDNRAYPHGWSEPAFQPDATWKQAITTGGSAGKTALATAISDYLYDSGSPTISQLRKRTIPLVKEKRVEAEMMAESHWVNWQIPPEEYFDMLTADAFTGSEGTAVQAKGSNSWTGSLQGADRGLVMTFEMAEQVVGFPYFSIEAPEGTIIELMVQQGHTPYNKGGPALINNNLNSWTRFICKEGRNEFMTFDYESVKWIQLHLHGTKGNVTVYRPGVMRREYDFFASPVLTTSDPALQKLFAASFNTILNNSQDTIVDCMGRERQQYSGDIGHVLHMLHRAYGEQRLPARFISTFSQGITLDGYFMDSWPAYDRLNRLSQRQLGLTPWGPLLDHSVGFTYDCWYHYLYSGRKEDLEEAFPRLVRFYHFLRSLWPAGGLLPVENLGVPAVWMDTDSYKKQRHKQCAFNLYVAGMLQDAFVKLCSAFGKTDLQQAALQMSAQLVRAVRKNFWSEKERMLVNNLPWHKEEGELRTCERSISQFILSGFVREEERSNLLQELIKMPPRFGSCYPPNAQWRYWALASAGIIQPVLDDFRTKWLSLTAVQQNNTMPETWKQVPDTHAQYSHAALAPIYLAYMGMAGITPLVPGASRIKIRPLPGDIEQFMIQNYQPQGQVMVQWTGKRGHRNLSVNLPAGVTAELWLDEREKVNLPLVKRDKGVAVYALQEQQAWTAVLQYT